MPTDYLILHIVYAISFILLAYIPRDRFREASIAFLFHQFITWFLGLLVVELRLLEYPVREFSDTLRTSFVYEFLAFPMIGVFYCLYFPINKSGWAKFLYTSAFATGLTIPEIFINKYTNLVEYHHWGWYVTWGSISTTLYLLGIFYRWYFRLES